MLESLAEDIVVVADCDIVVADHDIFVAVGGGVGTHDDVVVLCDVGVG